LKRSLKTGPSILTILAYLAPGVIIYSFSVVLPVLGAFYYSLFDWTGGPKMKFISFANYKELINDKIFWNSFGNNIYLTAVSVIGQVGLAFIFASILNSRHTKLKTLHRTLAYFPATVSAVVVGFVWSMIYDYNYGFLNTILRAVGAKDLAQPWLSRNNGIMLLVSIPIVWQYIGFYLVILLAAFTSIEKEVFEMAEIDGANGFQRAWYITLPLVRAAITVCIMLCISGNMKVFDHIYVMTGGGPGTASTVMAMYAYKTSFLTYRMGYGSALSIGILVLSLAIILISRVLLDRRSKEGGV